MPWRWSSAGCCYAMQSAYMKAAPMPLPLCWPVDFLEQMISPGERTTFDVEPVLPVAHTYGLVEVPRLDQVRAADLLNFPVSPVRDALTDKESPPRRWGGAMLHGPSVS
jgi:hypothetical protein